MKHFFTKGRIAFLIVFLVLLIDQCIKIWIKTHMYWHERFNVMEWVYDKLGIVADTPTWFYIFFTENNGMAFGMEIIDKLFLTSFRLMAVCVIGWMLYRFVRLQMKTGFLVCISLILAGALGNIIDCVCYGVCFDESTHAQIASFMPEGGGYAPWLYGKVVDMFYFPLIESTWPEWMPIVGGNDFIFFSPIFNFADAAISCGIVALLLFYSRYLNDAFSAVLTELKNKNK